MTKKYSVAVELIVLAEDEHDARRKAEDLIYDCDDLDYLKGSKVLAVIDKGK